MVEAGRNGAWRPIKNGDTLTRADAVRTAAGAGATLRLSAGTEVELREKVEIGLDRLPSGATVDLRHGKVFARVSGSDGLEINAHDTRTANDGPAHFVVMSDDNGRVSVAALTGRARFSAGGKSLSVPAGSESSSVAGGPPSDPERIPEEVLLDVVWPAEEQRHATDRASVEGHAPGVDQGDDQRRRRQRGPRRPVQRGGSAARRQEHAGRRGRRRRRAHAPRDRDASCAAARRPR